MAFQPNNANGQAAMAASAPVVIASNQSAIPVSGNQSAVSTTNWTSATTLNTANTISVVNLNTVTVAMSNTSTMTGGVLTFEVSPDGTNWFPIAMGRIDSYTVETTYTLNAVQARAWSTSVDGFTNFRVRLSTVITGTGTATVFITAQTFAIEPISTVGQATAALLNTTSVLAAGSAIVGKVGIDQTTPGTTNLVALAANQSTNTAQMNGVTVLMGNGVSGTGAQRVTIASDSTGQIALAAGTNAIGSVVPIPVQVVLTATPTVSTTPAYTIGDVAGAALTFTSAASASGRGCQITNALLIDKGKQSASLSLYLFKVSPTLVNADNGVFDITDANLATALPIGSIDFLAGNYKPTNSNSFCVGVINGGAPLANIVTSGSANIFGAFYVNGTPTYASTTDLIVYLTIAQF